MAARARNGLLFFGVLGPPIAWAVRLVVAYPLVPVACQQESLLWPALLSAGMLAVCLGAGVVALWLLRVPGEGSEGGRARFMAKSGVLLSLLFAAVILMESVPMFFGDPCLDVQTEPRRTRWTVLSALFVDDAHAHRLEVVPPPAEAWRMWNPDPLMWGALFVGVTLFLRGARRAARWQLVAVSAGFFALAVALLSPVDTVSGLLFSVHMAQHLLLMLVAAPLFAWGRPGVVALWALPLRARRFVGRLLTRARWVLRPGVAVTAHTAVVWLWHVPTLYDAALEYEALHVLEHACFFLSAWLFWAALRRAPGGAALLSLFLSMISMGLLSALLAVAPQAFYPPHAAGTPLWPLTPLEDQQLAGLLMWVPGGVVYLVAAVLIARRWLQRSESRAAVPPSVSVPVPPMPSGAHR